jgi:predicted pyridoxine 5'-phosphate oxidase superfamily flavin-nucleotide-binding protein
VIELTDEMRDLLATAITDGFPVMAASVDVEGQPKLTFYGSTHVHSADQLAIWVRNPDSGVLHRIAANPRMAFLYINRTAGKAWQFQGRARVVDDAGETGRIYDAIPEIEKLQDADRAGRAVIIDVDLVTGRGFEMRRDASE